MGIEPTWPAWKAGTLPLSYARPKRHFGFRISDWKSCRFAFVVQSEIRNPKSEIKLVVRGGFEPPKAEPADLQSAPFDRSGT